MQSLRNLAGAALMLVAILNAQPTITTIAGTDPVFDGEGKRAEEVTLGTIRGVAIERSGAVVFTDADFGLVLRLGPNNLLEVVAGSGVRGFSGDNGPARAARLGRVAGVAVDADSNIYFADNEEIRPRGAFVALTGRVRKVSPDGIISTIAGGGANSQDEDIQAVEASLAQVSGVAVDSSGNVYVTEAGRPRGRRISRDGRIRTFAGTGRPVEGPSPSDIGDGGPATASTLLNPIEVRVDREGGVLIVDLFGDRVRRVAPDGTIRTVVGGGRSGPPPLTATNVDIPRPTGVAVAPDGSVYVMTLFGIMKVAPDQRVTSLNSSAEGAPNNGGPVATAAFKSDFALNAMVSDSDGNIYVADSGHFQLRRIGTDGLVHAFAGSGLFRQAGENWPAAVSSFNSPTRLTVGSQGQIYFLERDSCKIREIQTNGLVRTVAGNGSCATRGGPNTPLERPSATDEGFGALSSVAADANGNVYVHDGIRVVRVAPDGRLSAVVNREARPLPPSEDGIPAINASLNGYSGGIALDRAGNLYVADTGRHRVRKVSDGIISTVAGSGPPMGPGAFAGDGAPASDALLDRPTDLAFDRSDNLFILDSGNGRIRKVSPGGIITTIVNLGAPVDFWTQMAIDAAGNIYVSDPRNHRVRRFLADGSLTTAAGTGEAGFSGDGGRPEAARLTEPTGVGMDAAGNVYVGDTGNHRIRRITAR